MADSQGTSKRQADSTGPGSDRPVKRLRASQRETVPGDAGLEAPSGNDGIAPAVSVARPFAQRPTAAYRPFALPERSLADKSRMLEKAGLRGNLVYKARDAGNVPVIAQEHQLRDMLRDGLAIWEERSRENAASTVLPPADPRKSRIFVIREERNARAVYEELPPEIHKKLSFEEQRYLGALPNWKLDEREMFDLGLIEENQLSLLSLEALRAESADRARSDNARPTARGGDTTAAGNRSLENPLQQPGHEKTAAVERDEFDDDLISDADLLRLEEDRQQPPATSVQQHWAFGETELYRLHPSDNYLADAMNASLMHLDPPSPDKVVLTKSGQDQWRLTPGGTDALADVVMIVREANGCYDILGAEGLKDRKLDEWTKRHGTHAVFLRDGENDFLSVDRYNAIYGTPYQPDAAGNHVAAISGRSSRADIPRLTIEDDEGDFVEIHGYLEKADMLALRKRNILILSPNGKALHNPWTSRKQDLPYFRSLTTNERVHDLLECYDQFKRPRKPLPTVLVRMDGRLRNAEELNVPDHRYEPLADRHPKENLFLLNHGEGRYTGNYRTLSTYSRPTLEQDRLLGRHPPTERERWAQIPHIVDPRTGPVAKIPAVVDETLPADIEAMNRRLVENGHAHESTFFEMPETLRASSVEPVSNPTGDGLSERRSFDPERHSRDRSSGL